MTERTERADTLQQAMQALSSFLVAEATLGETLQRLAEVSAGAVESAEVAGITLLKEGRKPTTVVYTDDRSPSVDQGQYEDDDGPCLEAYREQTLILVEDTRAAAERWPSFSEAAQEQGILSTLSAPLVVGDRGIGALNLYAGKPHAFDDDDSGLVSLLAAQVAIVVANASAYWDAYELSEQLNEAMRTRSTIEQAKGVLMAQSGIGADAAFEVLRKASQRENVKLREIAERIVERAQKR